MDHTHAASDAQTLDWADEHDQIRRVLAGTDRADDLLARAARALHKAASGARNRLGTEDHLARARVMLFLAVGELDDFNPDDADATEQIRVPEHRWTKTAWPRPDRTTTAAARDAAHKVEVIRHNLARTLAVLEGHREALHSCTQSSRLTA